jgi:hypothetical protein
MAPIFRLLAASGIFTLSCAAANAQVELNGVQIGTDDEASVVRVHPKAVCAAMSGIGTDRSCFARGIYAGVPARINYLIADAKVVGGSALFKADDYDRVVQALTDRYSKPPSPQENARGPSWALGEVTVVAIRNARDARNASIVLYETPAAKALVQRARRAKALQDRTERPARSEETPGVH